MAKRSRRRSTRRGGVQEPEAHEEGEVFGPQLAPPATPPSGTQAPGTQESGLSNTAPTGTGAAGQGSAASGSSAGPLLKRSEGVGIESMGVTPSGQGRRSSRRRGTKKSRKARKVSRRR